MKEANEGLILLSKTGSKSKKNDLQFYLFAGVFGLTYIFSIIDYIMQNPKDYVIISYFFLLPLLVGLLNKSFRTFVFSLLRVAWKRLTARNSLPVNIDDIDQMDGIAFEHYLKPVFERKGYLTKVTQGSGDYGADLILRKGGKKYVVQAKRYNSNIGVTAVQQVVAAVKYYKANGALVVTNQYFTPAAVKLAKVNGVRLIDREKLAKMNV